MKFSASKAALLAKCRYPFRPEHAVSAWPDSEDARFGKALHKCAEVWVKASKTREYPDIVMIAREYDVEGQLPRMIRVWKQMLSWLEGNVGDLPMSAELKIVVDLEHHTARHVDLPGERDYGPMEGPFQFGMTLDLFGPIGIRSADLPVVLDWKTGHTSEGYWGQIGLNVMAVAWLYGLRQVRGGLLHCTEDVIIPKIRLFRPTEIEAIAEDTYNLLADVATSSPNVGPHCTELRCGAFGNCPETVNVLARMEQMVPANTNGRDLSLTITDAEQAAYTLHRLKAYEALAKQIKAAVGRFVGDQEWPVADGVLRETYRNVNRTSTPDLIALARRRGATDEEIAACSYQHRESAGLRVMKG